MLLPGAAVKGGGAGRLFGSVTSAEISEALKAQHAIAIDKRKIVLDSDIKNYGRYEVEVKVYPSVTARITVSVEE